MYNCVIFDVDGTLFDTSEGIFECVNFVLREKNLHKLKRFIGPPIMESFQRYCGFSHDCAKELTEMYRNYYVKTYIKKSYMYPGMKALLDQMKAKNVKVTIATLKTQIQIDTLLKNENLGLYFDLVCGAAPNRKNKVDLINYIANQLMIKTGTMVMVGDSVLDAEGARKAGIDFIGVTYGFGLKEENDLTGIPYKKLCSSIDELRKEIG